MISVPSRRIILVIVGALLILCGLYCFLIPLNIYYPETTADSSKFLTILTEIDPPYAYLDRTGEIRGKSIEQVKLLADHTNTQYTLEFLPWSAGYGRTLSTPGTALVPTTWTEERAPLFRWVGPIDTIHYAFFARADDPIRIQTMPDDVKAVSNIAVVRNTAKHQYLLFSLLNGFPFLLFSSLVHITPVSGSRFLPCFFHGSQAMNPGSLAGY
jgi:ABC-type amino acid transport substrate-binding protein